MRLSYLSWLPFCSVEDTEGVWCCCPASEAAAAVMCGHTIDK
jgi:hypothetical protein